MGQGEGGKPVRYMGAVLVQGYKADGLARDEVPGRVQREEEGRLVHVAGLSPMVRLAGSAPQAAAWTKHFGSTCSLPCLGRPAQQGQPLPPTKALQEHGLGRG